MTMIADEPHSWREAPSRMSAFYPELERLTTARMFFGTRAVPLALARPVDLKANRVAARSSRSRRELQLVPAGCHEAVRDSAAQ